MNCNEFEALVNDLARKRMIDAALREKADSHARDCARCNARLVEEKQLTVGLRALAILDENKKASANIEANLLTAFRKNAGATHTPVSAVSAVTHKSRINYWWAAAAVLLILFAIAALRIQQKDKIEQTPEQVVQQPQGIQPDNRKDKEIAGSTGGDTTPVDPPKRQNRKTPAPKALPKDLNKLPLQVVANSPTSKPAAPETLPSQQQPAQSELTTPFISLTQGYTLPMPEGGQVLRVELPRSALASFGMPVNEERLNERVKADVVVGNDGIPRAIRFVR